MKPELQKPKWSVPLAITALAVVGALALFGLLALPDPGPASAQTGACADGGSGFQTTPTTGPAAPTLEARNTALNVMLPAAADGDAAAATNGSPEYTGFDIRYRQGTSGTFTTFTGEITVNQRNLSGAARITGLTNGQSYQVQVRVTCADTFGPWSDSATASPAPSAPGPVRNLRVQQLWHLSASDNDARGTDPNGMDYCDCEAVYLQTHWDLPTDNGGSPVTSYVFKGWTGEKSAAIGTLTNVYPGTGTTATWKNNQHPNYPTEFSGAGFDTGITAGNGDHNLWWKFEVSANNTAGTGPATSVTFRIDKDAIVDFATTDFSGTIASDSTTSGDRPKLTVKLNNLAAGLPVGSSVVLFLEDDFEVPDSIPASSIYFVANSPSSTATGNGSPVYATVSPEIEEDEYFDNDKDDVSIRVRVPDMCTGDSDACEGPNGFARGQDLTMVILGSSGIKNPSEAGRHTVAFDVLRFDDSLPGRIERLMTNGMERAASAGSIAKRQGVYVSTSAKITLSDADGKRNETLTVKGSGFNDGVTASAYVAQRKAAEFAVAQWWNTLNCESRQTEMGGGNEFCFNYTLNSSQMTYTAPSRNKASGDMVIARHLCERGVIPAGTEAGNGTVGDNDEVSISIEVTVPTFKPGNNNLICVEDGEGRTAGEDVEDFELTPSIRVSPDEGRVGDEVTIFAQDFPTAGASLTELKVGGVVITDSIRSNSISSDGSATATFELPPQKGTKRVDAKWGTKSEDATVTILPAIINVSKSDPLPNERVTITGTGFSTGAGSGIRARDITIDSVPLHVYDDSLDGDDEVEVSSGGQFVAAVAVWPADDDASNPTLTPGRHTIEVVDKKGFPGEVEITIPNPAVKTTPDVAGPRDVVTVSGENWPVDNPENSISAITVKVTDGERERQYSVYADGSGRWFIEHRVDNSVPIPSTSRIEVKYGDLVRQGEYEIPSSIISVDPGEGRPGARVTMSVEKMPVHSRVSRIEIGGRDVMPAGTPSTDRDGSVTVSDVVIPGLDPGAYSVLLEVGSTVAIGQLAILPEGPTGASNPLPDALSALGDNLKAVFYFDGISKEWLFYDPRPEFAGLNTLTGLVPGQAYWILVGDNVADVALNGKSRSLTCSSGNCWNLMVW